MRFKGDWKQVFFSLCLLRTRFIIYTSFLRRRSIHSVTLPAIKKQSSENRFEFVATTFTGIINSAHSLILFRF